MCGFVAIVDLQGTRPIDGALIRSLTRRLNHRGPDGEGYLEEPGVALGHRRLAIIDIAAGQQPMFNEDGSVAVVFNGEIYNFESVRKELIGLGHVFATSSDTEVIVHGWEEWGRACVDRFRGMFAFALWDRRTQDFFLARDRLGIKPLYYTVTGDGLLVAASELKSIVGYPGIPTDLDIVALDNYLTSLVLGTHCF
jgi:asparagine synthase (glutamine-hydrolysing)